MHLSDKSAIWHTAAAYQNVSCQQQKPLYSSKKKPYPPQGRSLEIPRGRGVLKAKILEVKYEAKLEFPGRRGVQKKKPSVGGVWIFPGTAHRSLFPTCLANLAPVQLCRQDSNSSGMSPILIESIKHSYEGVKPYILFKKSFLEKVLGILDKVKQKKTEK